MTSGEEVRANDVLRTLYDSFSNAFTGLCQPLAFEPLRGDSVSTIVLTDDLASRMRSLKGALDSPELCQVRICIYEVYCPSITTLLG